MEDDDSRAASTATSSKGLYNRAGENNCFLNCAVQVLWQLDAFRSNFRLFTEHACLENSCIFCALKVIFTHFQFNTDSVLPPDALRRAMADTFVDEHRFQLGLMDDAAECFENILLRIHFHLSNGSTDDACDLRHCITHQKFSMALVEQYIMLTIIRKETFAVSFNLWSISIVISEARDEFPDETFGSLVRRAISNGERQKRCSINCGKTRTFKRTLTNIPEVVTIGFIWESAEPTTDDVTKLVYSIGQNIFLADMFDFVLDPDRAESCILQLVGVVCYYGRHYSTFFFHIKKNVWISFDDANVTELDSSWDTVVMKCVRGRYQPLLLIYQSCTRSEISTITAPKMTFMLNNYAPKIKVVSPAVDRTSQSVSNTSRQSGTSSESQKLPCSVCSDLAKETVCKTSVISATRSSSVNVTQQDTTKQDATWHCTSSGNHSAKQDHLKPAPRISKLCAIKSLPLSQPIPTPRTSHQNKPTSNQPGSDGFSHDYVKLMRRSNLDTSTTDGKESARDSDALPTGLFQKNNYHSGSRLDCAIQSTDNNGSWFPECAFKIRHSFHGDDSFKSSPISARSKQLSLESLKLTKKCTEDPSNEINFCNTNQLQSTLPVLSNRCNAKAESPKINHTDTFVRNLGVENGSQNTKVENGKIFFRCGLGEKSSQLPRGHLTVIDSYRKSGRSASDRYMDVCRSQSSPYGFVKPLESPPDFNTSFPVIESEVAFALEDGSDTCSACDVEAIVKKLKDIEIIMEYSQQHKARHNLMLADIQCDRAISAYNLLIRSSRLHGAAFSLLHEMQIRLNVAACQSRLIKLELKDSKARNHLKCTRCNDDTSKTKPPNSPRSQLNTELAQSPTDTSANSKESGNTSQNRGKQIRGILRSPKATRRCYSKK